MRESVCYYEGEAAGLGAEFAAEVRVAVDRIHENLYSGAPVEAGTRRKLLQRFPYSLIYLVEGEEEHICIIAVMHHRRRPGYWRGRV
ncbi:MAG: type II toxin-antitoxin system RelE/ParE family toxin [Candidatus Omnitrophota bacterium]|nr:MAG: type II toxin-antitoxin system RelE/ParE family toxin [Candidatus Omnitrophota bacterium]